MSISTLRHHFSTFAFLPARRERQISKALRTLRIRMSRRKVKCLLRAYIQRMHPHQTKSAYA